MTGRDESGQLSLLLLATQDSFPGMCFHKALPFSSPPPIWREPNSSPPFLSTLSVRPWTKEVKWRGSSSFSFSLLLLPLFVRQTSFCKIKKEDEEIVSSATLR